jgi:hypothetical protein
VRRRYWAKAAGQPEALAGAAVAGGPPVRLGGMAANLGPIAWAPSVPEPTSVVCDTFWEYGSNRCAAQLGAESSTM